MPRFEPKPVLSEPDIPGWFAIGELNLLYAAVCDIRAARCLEIGTYMGRSAFALCSALRDLGGGGRLVCVDTFASPVSMDYYRQEFMVTMMARYPSVRGLYSDVERCPSVQDALDLTLRRFPFMRERIEVRVGSSRHLDLGQEPFDLVLIDGDHSYEGVRGDYRRVRPLVRRGGIICFHDDSPHFPGVQRFIQEVAAEPGLELAGSCQTARAFRVIEPSSARRPSLADILARIGRGWRRRRPLPRSDDPSLIE